MREKADYTNTLAAVAMGRQPAETVIQGASLVNVNTGEIQPDVDIAIACGRIALVGDAAHTIGPDTKVVDGNGLWAAPGFMDGHIHVESSMMTVREYARTVLPHGTTAIFPDPHEIANVLGTRGVEFMVEDAADLPLRVFTMMPSCVPAVSGFEDAGAEIGAEDVSAFMQRDDIFGLGEMMNFPGVLSGDEEVHRKLQATLEAGKTLTGHYSMPETGAGLNAYIASGMSCCHESTRAKDALAKMRLGMYVQIREGSAWHDLKQVVRAILDNKVDTRFACLISDDTHPHTLVQDGHMDHIVRRAIQEGVDPVTAIQMVTINTAQCFGMAGDLGSISPGKLADLVLLSDLQQVEVEQVYAGGTLVAKAGKLTAEIQRRPCPQEVKNTMRLPQAFSPKDFRIKAPIAEGPVTARVIQVIEARVGTIAREMELMARHGLIRADVEQDVSKLAVVERHNGTGEMGKGFVTGFGLKAGAVASTVAHDAHNLMIVGTNGADMALAGNVLTVGGGGMVAVRDGEVLAQIALPVAGLMCEESALEIARKVAALDKAWQELGCSMVSPFMTMALLSLAVLPELRLTNKGLIDTVNYKFTQLFV